MILGARGGPLFTFLPDIVLERGAELFIPVEQTVNFAAAVKEVTGGLDAHNVHVDVE